MAARKPGRPKKERPAQDFFENAESYLSAVVRGETPPDAARIAAAKCLISYQKGKQRAPVKSLPPAEMARKEAKAEDRAIAEDFEEKAKIIREKHARRTQQ